VGLDRLVKRVGGDARIIAEKKKKEKRGDKTSGNRVDYRRKKKFLRGRNGDQSGKRQGGLGRRAIPVGKKEYTETGG